MTNSETFKSISRTIPKPVQKSAGPVDSESFDGKISAVAKGSAVACGSSTTPFLSYEQIWLMVLYDKDEAADLTAKEKKQLKQAIRAEKAARARVNK